MKSVVVLLALVVGSAHTAFAQFGKQRAADPTATRALTVGVFAGGSYSKPDEGNFYNNYQPGYVAGVNIARHFGRTSISIEPTYGRSTGGDTSFDFFLGDVLIARDIGPMGHIHPFAALGIGYGVVHYPGQLHDDSIVRSLGLGAGYDLSHNFAVRAQWVYRYWNVGTETDGFNPNGVQTSVSYRFGFGLKRNRH